MSASAPPTLPLPKIIERDRDSWTRHDIVALTDLFADQFSYTIDGVARFPTKKALRNYWCKNAFRQQELDLRFLDAKKVRGGYDALFTAIFYHPTRFALTSVFGSIEIRTDKSGEKIVSIAERYEKLERFSPCYGPDSIRRYYLLPAVRWVKRRTRPVWSLLRAASRNMLTLAFAVGVAAAAYVGWFHGIRPILSEELVTEIKTWLPYWFAASYLIQQSLPFFKKPEHLDISVDVLADHEDLSKMTAQIRDADFVQIISGDFSFLDINPELETCLRSLAFAKKLELFSYKSQATVEEELNSKTRSREILLRLIDEGRFHFDCPVEAKVTLVEKGGQRRMLFRFAKDEGDGSEFHMGIIRPTHNTAYLLSVVDRMMTTLRTKAA